MEKDSSTTAAAMLALSLTQRPTPAPTRVPSRAVVGAIESAVVKEQIRRQLPSGTSSDDTSDEQPTPKAAAALRQCKDAGEKKRKPTYYMRKDEMAQLQEEIATLQAKIRQLEDKSMCVTQTLGTALDHNAVLQSRVRHGDLTVARAQSLLSSYGTLHRTSPLGGFIHLPRNVLDRQHTLSALKMPRIEEAVAYTLARSQFLDVTKTTCQIDTFETDAGDFVTTHWEITPLHDARSVRRAFEEVLYFYETQEMTLSEKIGVLSIRESESETVDGVQALRLLSKHDNGAQVETNLALFSHYFEKSEMLDQPHALLVVDYVDQDDLYSFQPQSRIQKDVVSSVMITEVPATRGGSSSTSGPPMVTMIRLAFVRVNSSAYTSRSVLEQVARGGSDKWCDVMLKCVLERLAWRS